MESATLLCLLEEITQVKYDELWSRHNLYRQTVRDFWNELGHAQRLAIVETEQESLFSKLDGLQMEDCACRSCIVTRIKLKAELSNFFQKYHNDLPSFTDQDKPKIDLCMMISKEPSYLGVVLRVDRRSDLPQASDEEVQKQCVNDIDSTGTQHKKHIGRQKQFKQSVIIFTLLAARMIEKHIIHFYQEALALQRQNALIEEIEHEEKQKLEEKKRRDEHKKEILNKKRLLKQQEQEKLLEEQKKKELEEQQSREEKRRQGLLKSQAKMKLKESERRQKQEQRLKSLAKQKNKKEQKILELKKIKEQGKQQTYSTPALSTSTSLTVSSTRSSTPFSTTLSILLKQDENKDEKVGKESLSVSYKSPVGCSPIVSHSCILPESEAHPWSLFSKSLVEATDSEEQYKVVSNKSSIWSNGWDGSTSVSENFHDCIGHNAPKKETHSIIAIVKHVYTILDHINFTRYYQLPSGYPLFKLHMMIHELLNDDSISIDELHQAIISSNEAGFQCRIATNNILTVQLINSV